MAAESVGLSKIITDKKSVEDLYGQFDRLRRELDRALNALDGRIKALEEK
ncbi:MAG: hypothetical protein IJY33_03670 [Oscillospiraceae bacterium]|nr:hypothetical protein [Oscillospiraceae bacterium]